jgi:Spy/CpxP family protein refolding chaperone
MTKFPLVVALVAAATVVTAEARGWAGRGGGRPDVPRELSRELFSPELVMRHQEEIGLSEDQRSKLVHVTQEMQSDLVPLQFEMGQAAGKLREALAVPRIDEAKAGDLADRLMGLETKIKRRHLTTMIQIKNVLTPEQQDRLRALREQDRAARRDRRGDRPSPPEEDGAAPAEPED